MNVEVGYRREAAAGQLLSRGTLNYRVSMQDSRGISCALSEIVLPTLTGNRSPYMSIEGCLCEKTRLFVMFDIGPYTHRNPPKKQL